MYRIAVCEDEPNLRERLCTQCREVLLLGGSPLDAAMPGSFKVNSSGI